MNYQAWTYEAVRDRVVEAAQTLLSSPADLGPRAKQGAFSDLVAAVIQTEYDRAPSYRRILSAGALSRMEETWKWINDYLDEEDRKLVYDYGFIKSRKGLYLDRYLEKNDMVRRTFERRIKRCCQLIADNLNRLYSVRFTERLDDVSQIEVDIVTTKVSSEKCANHWRAPDAKPKNIPSLHEKMKPAA
ncbi:hypothetical protein [Brucella lupini]|uniref:Uncharacterized protein n=1 Tax=Brucella lupini TaxID=255457 RepID=A0A256GGK6_9HYPH|nr:hypothetical protein [Brucella lupini]KAB2701332.1 hypothetical protein F9L03_24115 [Brucella lupini]OYR26262.1 hypothetical protein CES86_3730 [Brucella lupini]